MIFGEKMSPQIFEKLKLRFICGFYYIVCQTARETMKLEKEGFWILVISPGGWENWQQKPMTTVYWIHNSCERVRVTSN